jgi:hypothetical protein
MRDADATESTSEAAYNEVRQSQKNLNGGHITLLPGQKQPAVPAIPSGIALPPPPPANETNPVGATPNPVPQGSGMQPYTPPASEVAPSLPLQTSPMPTQPQPQQMSPMQGQPPQTSPPQGQAPQTATQGQPSP